MTKREQDFLDKLAELDSDSRNAVILLLESLYRREQAEFRRRLKIIQVKGA